jgi:hypothetical protein
MHNYAAGTPGVGLDPPGPMPSDGPRAGVLGPTAPPGSTNLYQALSADASTVTS